MSETSVKHLGVMGGTFDPIHLGHLIAASEVLHALELDRVLFVPAGKPWQKDDYSDAEDRMLMTILATSVHPQFAVSRMELDRKGPTYTHQTLRELQRFYPDARLFFIAGTDAIAQLATWNGFDELKDLADFVAVDRPGSGLEIETSPQWPRLHRVDIPPIGISATEIRERVRHQRPIEFMVPAAVAAYIREQGLYVGQTEDDV